MFNFTDTQLAVSEYVVLAKGLKFVPTPSTKVAKKNYLLKDFNEFERKMKCKLPFFNKKEDIHPFRTKSGFEPPKSNGTLETFIDKVKLELTSMEIQKFNDNLSKNERKALNELRKRKDIVKKRLTKTTFVLLWIKMIISKKAIAN